jgi:adenylate cyclase
MALEIERKFLVKDDGWKSSCVRSIKIRDGLIAHSNGRKARVRMMDGKGTIAVKGAERGLSRAEFEYPIPVADAEEMLRTMCDDFVLEKTRYIVPHAGLVWEVDVYDGILQGVVIAEVELKHESEAIVFPDWIGTEVTKNPNYKKANMLAERMAAVKPEFATV